MKSDEIAAELDEDATDNPGANLRYVVNSAEYQPYYRDSGEWTLSLVGEYLWGSRGPDTIEQDDEDRDDGDDGQSQTSLSDLAGETGGDGDE